MTVKKRIHPLILLATALGIGVATPPAQAQQAQGPQDCVVLLHGLARSYASMNKIEQALATAGYRTVNQGYPSTTQTIEQLSAFVGTAMKTCAARRGEKIHFVTHSLGGILLRYYLAHNPRPKNLGRVVMLAPPNQGSGLADIVSKCFIFRLIEGPALRELRSNKLGITASLPGVDYPVGVITGDAPISPTTFFLPRPNDGIITVASSRVEGMSDHIVLPVSHSFIMNNTAVIAQTLAFLKMGHFAKEGKDAQKSAQALQR